MPSLSRHRLIAAGLIGLSALTFDAIPAPAFYRHCFAYECHIPFTWDDAAPPSSYDPPLPQGFVLTVPVVPRTGDGVASSATLNRYADVARALVECWDPRPAVGDHRWGAITVRVSFKRDGRINGIPRIPYVSDMADDTTGAALRSSLLSALSQCTPLHVSASLGNAIAGQIFAIRFIQQGTS